MRVFWLSLGCLALASGAAGLLLPLLPTTPFLILAAFCFARSSPILHDWLVTHPRFGPPIEMWRVHGAVTFHTKLSAAILMALTLLISFAMGTGAIVLVAQAMVMLAVAAFLFTRPNGPGHEP